MITVELHEAVDLRVRWPAVTAELLRVVDRRGPASDAVGYVPCDALVGIVRGDRKPASHSPHRR